MQPLEIAGGAKKADGRRGIGSAPLARLLRQARKPSSVPRAEAWGMVICLGRLSPTASSSLPAARRISRPGGRCGSHLAAYLALLRLGVTVPPLLPAMRWALTPPFHPCRSQGLRPGSRRSLLCGPIRRLTAPRRYLAVYPLELGLSSSPDRSKLQPEPATIRPACAL